MVMSKSQRIWIVGMMRPRGLRGNVVAHVARHVSTRSLSDDGAHTGRPVHARRLSARRRDNPMLVACDAQHRHTPAP